MPTRSPRKCATKYRPAQIPKLTLRICKPAASSSVNGMVRFTVGVIPAHQVVRLLAQLSRRFTLAVMALPVVLSISVIVSITAQLAAPLALPRHLRLVQSLLALRVKFASLTAPAVLHVSRAMFPASLALNTSARMAHPIASTIAPIPSLLICASSSPMVRALAWVNMAAEQA